jgi:predicted PhzF superfamily epimerase YddE/YHI9
MTRKHIIYQVDAFTDKPFAGNPAGVCILTRPADPLWMQDVAAEMNLSETAFLHPEDEDFHLRWFTPRAEVELCGHATLASSHILWETGTLDPIQEARFHTLSGLLTARQIGEWIEMDFPSEPEQSITPPPELVQALNAEPVYIGANRFDYLVELESASDVRNVTPDFNLLKEHSARGVIITSISDDSQFDFISRFFAPAVGINEDPVTGSAHCCLGPYWRKKLGKDEFNAYQASERGGVVKLTIAGDRVLLRGKAVSIMRSELLV